MDFDNPSLLEFGLVFFLVGQFVFLVNGFIDKLDSPRTMLLKSFAWFGFFVIFWGTGIWKLLVKPFVTNEWLDPGLGATDSRNDLDYGLSDVRSECPMPAVKPARDDAVLSDDGLFIGEDLILDDDLPLDNKTSIDIR